MTYEDMYEIEKLEDGMVSFVEKSKENPEFIEAIPENDNSKNRTIKTPKEAYDACIEYRVKNGFGENDSKKELDSHIAKDGFLPEVLELSLNFNVFASPKMARNLAPLLCSFYKKEA